MLIARDDAADAVVDNDAKLQDHIHARSLILWLPGMSAGIAAQICLMISGIGIALSLLFAWPLEAENFKYYVGGIALGGLPMAVLSNQLVRGLPFARNGMLWLSVAYAGIAALEAGGFLFLARDTSLKIALIGLLAGLAAVRLVASPSYALLAAVYRAQRVHLRSLE